MKAKTLRLSRPEQRKLEDWLVANIENLKSTRKSREQIAVAAEATLGFKVHASHVSAAMRAMELELPRPLKANGKGSSNTTATRNRYALMLVLSETVAKLADGLGAHVHPFILEVLGNPAMIGESRAGVASGGTQCNPEPIRMEVTPLRNGSR